VHPEQLTDKNETIQKNGMNLADAAFSGLAALLGGDNSGNLSRDGILAVLFFPELFVMFFQY